jgi:hypothetical protein
LDHLGPQPDTNRLIESCDAFLEELVKLPRCGCQLWRLQDEDSLTFITFRCLALLAERAPWNVSGTLRPEPPFLQPLDPSAKSQ